MAERVVVEIQIRRLLRSVIDSRPELMREALELLVRRCDAKLPMLAPSLFTAPLTVASWNAFLARESIVAKRRGDVMEVLARRMNNALADPRCEKLELLVRCWLPDEDALREVTIATRDAVASWWNDPETHVGWDAHAVFTPSAHSARLALEDCVIAQSRVLGSDGMFDVPFDLLDATLDDVTTRAEGLVALEDFLRKQAARYQDLVASIEVDELANGDGDGDGDDAGFATIALLSAEAIEAPFKRRDASTPERRPDVADARRIVCSGFADALANATSDARGAIMAYQNSCNWCWSAALSERPSPDSLMIRRHFDVPDLERALVAADARDATARR